MLMATLCESAGSSVNSKWPMSIAESTSSSLLSVLHTQSPELHASRKKTTKESATIEIFCGQL